MGTKVDSLNSNESYDLLIISPLKFKKILEILVNHKKKVGILAKIVTLNEIYSAISNIGRDKPEKIKYFIKSAIEKWKIKYVLLVGNDKLIPVRYVHNSDYWPNHPEPFFISELYYADIFDEDGNFSSWDTNNDGIFGEWKGNCAKDPDIDLNPDVCLGRLACRNKYEVFVTVNKIINYEKKTYGKKWFKHIITVAGDTSPIDKGYLGEKNSKIILEYMKGFKNSNLWTSDGSLSGSKDVVKLINNGCGFIYFDGHSITWIWYTNLPDKNKFIRGLSTFSMNFLDNKEMLPICLVAGCNTLQFDLHFINLLKNTINSVKYWTWLPECWGWKLTRKRWGGSIATIGNTNTRITQLDKKSKKGGSEYLFARFFYEYGINKIDILGKIWGSSISNYLDNFPIKWDTPECGDSAYDARTVQGWALFGDPSLKVGGYKI
jgi:hypothetical protein